ncbi:ATP-binding protein [Gaopeijia maritima]|uniref:hybrid sensor histidine kinase/response regulator n=1 Tax=Gaopeijia maritima TaxID=3119007 RepID=UPI003251F3EC
MFDADRLRAVRESGLLESPNIGEGLAGAVRLAAAALGAQGGFVVVVDPETPRVLCAVGPDDVASALGARLLEPLAREQPLTVPLAATHSQVREASPVRQGRVGSLVATPVRGPLGHVIAGLCLWRAEPYPWSPVELALLDDARAEVGERLRGWMLVHDRAEQRGGDSPHRADLVRELERREDWFDVVLDSLPAGVLVARAPSGEAVRANREMLRLLDVLDLASVDVERPAWSASGARIEPERHPLSRALAGETVRGELLCSKADIEAEDGIWWRVNAAPLHTGSGEVAGAVLTIEDITETRGMQAALYRSQEHLLHAQKMEAVGRLAGGMAHDFNNLLTAIMGFGELLLEGMTPDDPAWGDAEEIVRSAARGRDLTDQLLSFSRRRSTDPAVIDLNEVVASSRRLVERLMEEKVTFETELGPTEGRVRIDRTELEQIVVNLALNARDAVPGPGGTVRVRTGPVNLARTLDAEPEAIPPGRWETLIVSDDGSGMDAALRLRIFEPFFTTKPAGQGTGLGLSTVYGIVKRVGGFVRVDSKVGEGTTFTVYLPPADGAVTAAETEGEGPARGSERVLLVEDQDQIRSLLARQLRRSGFEVIEAANGYEALNLWQSEPDAFDIVVSDVIMPVMDGPTMVSKARATRPDLPVVFISGYPGAADPAERDTPLPDAPLLRKPFAAAELVATIRSTLDESGG